MKTLVFDVFGDFGHFRKFYTTSSPLSFSFPSPPTVKGMLAAIAGVDKRDYLEVFASGVCKIAVRILTPVKKIRMGINHINTKGNYWVPVKKGTHEARTQIRTEFLKDPAYRFYVAHADSTLFARLAGHVREHKTVFTLSLGLSELLADFRFVDVLSFTRGEPGEREIATVIPAAALDAAGIVFEGGKSYFKEKIPVEMNPDRVVERYEDVLFEAQGKPVRARVKEYWQGENGECATFF